MSNRTAEKDARGLHATSRGSVRRPLLRLPGIDRQPKRGFSDQDVAGHDFKRFTAWVWASLVIAGDHPHLIVDHQSDLCRSQHVSRAVKRHARLIEPKLLAVGHRMEIDVAPQSLAEHPFTDVHSPVFAASRSGVIRMGMRDQCSGDRPWGINPGIRCSAIKTAVGSLEHVHPTTLASPVCSCVLRPLGEPLPGSLAHFEHAPDRCLCFGTNRFFHCDLR